MMDKPVRAARTRIVSVQDMVRGIWRALDKMEIVRQIVEAQSADNQELMWNYLEGRYADEAIALVSVLKVGSGDNVVEAGRILLELAQYHKDCIDEALAERSKPIRAATAQRQSLRDEGIAFAESKNGTFQFKKDFVEALVAKFGITESRADAWLDVGRKSGAFHPPSTYSKSGRPSKKNK